MNQSPKLLGQEASQSRKVVTSVSVALAAVAMAAENSPMASAVGIRPPELTRTDQRLQTLSLKMKQLINHRNPLSYRQVVTLQGKKTEQLIVSHKSKNITTGNNSYVQVVLDRPIGQPGIDMATLVVGAATPNFHIGEKYDSVTSLVINSENTDQYMLWDYYPTNGVYENHYWYKNGIQNSHWVGSSPHQPISESQLDKAFDNFTNTITKIGSIGSP